MMRVRRSGHVVCVEDESCVGEYSEDGMFKEMIKMQKETDVL